MRILVTGSKGQLGSDLKELSNNYPEYQFYHTDVEELNITDKKSITEFVDLNDVTVIINCAAYTAVDKAEAEPELANTINHVAVKHLSEVARDKKATLIHISTDYVFSGQAYMPYKTDHITNPVNMYGKTKLNGEMAMQDLNPPNSMIIRTSWVYSSYGNNFVKTMLRLGSQRPELNVISDQVGSPTYARDLAEFILSKAIHSKNRNVKTYHFANSGVCSWYDFAKEIMEIGNLKCSVNPIPTSAYPTPAQRPHYSLLNKDNIKEDFDFSIPYWKDSLKQALKKIKYSN